MDYHSAIKRTMDIHNMDKPLVMLSKRSQIKMSTHCRIPLTQNHILCRTGHSVRKQRCHPGIWMDGGELEGWERSPGGLREPSGVTEVVIILTVDGFIMLYISKIIKLHT